VAGVYARAMDVTAPPLFSYNAGAPFPTASTIKIAIMLTAFQHEARHPGALSDRVKTRRAALISGSPFMDQAADGQAFTVLQLIRPMITLSDNTASNDLIDYFGMNEINRVIAGAGLRHTHLKRKFLDYSAIVRHHDNVTTPRDMANLLFSIERGAREGIATVAPPLACRSMIEIMLGQTDREGIPAGLPMSVAVANKTGAVDGVRNDIAIVNPFGDSPFVLAIYTKGLTNYAGAYTMMRRMAGAIYRLVARTGR
jgi:beta-lactamase class A